MSRSNPTDNSPNPSTRWFEWRGGEGQLCWYDKEKKERVVMPDGFVFLLLDHLSTVKGYNKKAKSGIYANEVRDTRKETLTVKFFSGDTIAEGFWQSIKEKVSYAKGKFAVSCYIAFRDGDSLKIGNIMFSGCSLGPWFEFYAEHRKECDSQSVVIRAGEKDTSGTVDFIPPKFSLKPVSPETDEQAKALDTELQTWLKGYFSRKRTEQVDESITTEPEPPFATEPDDDSVPF